MKIIGLGLMLLALVLLVDVSQATPANVVSQDVKTTPTYEILILKKVAVTAALKQQLETYTAKHPTTKKMVYELACLNREIDRLTTLPQSQGSNLSEVYGHLIVRKIELEVAEHELREQVAPAHPELRKMRIELAALQQQIDELLQ